MTARLLLVIALAVSLPSRSEEPETAPPARASILTAKAARLDLDTIKKFAGDARIEVASEKKGETSFSVALGNTKIIVNVDDNYDQETQNKGALGWISRFPKEDRNTKAARKLIKYLPTVKRSYGLVLPKGFDPTGKATTFILDLTRELNGYAMTGSTIYDKQGFTVIGHPLDPPFFGPPGKHLSFLKKPTPLKDLLPGKWDAGLTFVEEDEELRMTMTMNSVDEFRPDGSHRSNGSVEMLMEPIDEEGGVTMGLDFSVEGRWEIKDEKLLIHGDKTETANLQCELPELREAVEEMAKELRKADDPDVCWAIVRDRNTIILEEIEAGAFVTMKRVKGSK